MFPVAVPVIDAPVPDTGVIVNVLALTTVAKYSPVAIVTQSTVPEPIDAITTLDGGLVARIP